MSDGSPEVLFVCVHNAGRSQMAAALTHDLNQPLTAIINSVNAAKRLLAHEDHVSLVIAQ